MSPCFAVRPSHSTSSSSRRNWARHRYSTGELLACEQPCLDALREIDLLLRSEQRNAANFFQIGATGSADGAQPTTARDCAGGSSFVVFDRRGVATSTSSTSSTSTSATS